MRHILAFALALLAAPALGQDCYYENYIGERAYPEFAAVTFHYHDGSTDYCPSQGVGTGLPYRMATCESGEEGPYAFYPSTLGGDDAGLLVWRSDLFYRQCD